MPLLLKASVFPPRGGPCGRLLRESYSRVPKARDLVKYDSTYMNHGKRKHQLPLRFPNAEEHGGHWAAVYRMRRSCHLSPLLATHRAHRTRIIRESGRARTTPSLQRNLTLASQHELPRLRGLGSISDYTATRQPCKHTPLSGDPSNLLVRAYQEENGIPSTIHLHKLMAVRLFLSASTMVY